MFADVIFRAWATCAKTNPKIQRVNKVNNPYRISPHQILESYGGYVKNAISFLAGHGMRYTRLFLVGVTSCHAFLALGTRD